ncbi:Crotonyl-CoA reductase [Defluviimonas aquaemixtae]|uniref:Crotonyl-CoA reductase n=1 Tax=Albidovulum aquaemixtae TaxID=1542388 RepID=A0A2R8B6U0_9RHOB|nr:zinc-binding dehydrogenase [Defluviimonas aquaemixtae]SPH18272.1 Crotonyl-CoA reductase [Defluviimonas aquaemixtae]
MLERVDPDPCAGSRRGARPGAAAGVNNTDINTRIGWYSKEVTGSTEECDHPADVDDGGWAGALQFPRIQGSDLCGEAVALGAEAGKVAVGKRVICPTSQPNPTEKEPTRILAIGSEFDGAFAQNCVVPANQLHDVTDAPLTDIELGAIPCAYGTAFNLLSRSGVGPGDRVVIAGASGGVGLAAVQLAKLRGARVCAVASASKQAMVRAAGPDELLDRDQTPPPKSGTVVIDVVGGPGWRAFVEALMLAGRYARSEAIAGPIVNADLRTLHLKDLTIYGCTYTPHETFAELVALINTGAVKPLVSKTYPLSDIAVAQADFVAKAYPGKLVLIPPDI